MPYAKRNQCVICGKPCRKKFCSKRCYGDSMIRSQTRKCDNCSKEYTALRHYILKGLRRCCSITCANKLRARPLNARFWSYVEKRKGCWDWKGTIDKDGYAVISDENRRQIRAQRLSYELNHGPIPKGKHVLHRCDNPPCVNPAHLFLGSNLDNIADKVSKGRQAKGPGIKRNKLAPEDIPEIRRYLKFGNKHTDIAKDFGVSAGTIQAIGARRIWKHIP
jgi:hypothetical protein